MRFEVLVATMNQIDESLYKKMNLQMDAVIANQCDRNDYKEYSINGNKIKIISTTGRGVGKNRNIALLNATADIILFADDDMVYEDKYQKGVISAFESLPDADIILFNIEKTIKEKNDYIIKSIDRVRIYNFLRYGTLRIACRRDGILKANLWFSLLFGGGAQYSSGEDSLFLREALRKGLKIYKYPFKIAITSNDTSTWFKGFNKKYFKDKGVFLANAFPFLKYLMCIYYSIKCKKYTKDYNSFQIFNMILKGIREYEKG
jgi:glycosyltransferase involved in cell wall biosynthesis